MVGFRRSRQRRGILALVVLVACGGGGQGESAGASDTAVGEVTALDYEVTEERYQRWVTAQQALDAIPGLPAPPRIDPMRLGEPDIRRAVEYLESDARARTALGRAGISARDYVLTTVALDQALVTAASSDPASAPLSGAAGAPAASDPAAGPPRANRPAPSGAASGAASRVASGAASVPPRATARPDRPRLTGTPQRNVELVRRNRADVVRVMRTMRFRVSETVADELADSDTSVTRSDSVSVGKGVTVKWDVTVRRNRDTTARKQGASTSASDTARRDSTPR